MGWVKILSYLLLYLWNYTQVESTLFNTTMQNHILWQLMFSWIEFLQELTSSAGEDVVLAMNTFIKRLLAVSDPNQMKVSLFTAEQMFY